MKAPFPELTQILGDHAKKYPCMEPQDAVKLIYQNEFGGGHLIADEAVFLQRLREEYAAVTKDSNAPLREDIGNGVYRVYLAALPEAELESLGREFIKCAAVHTGTLDNFLAKLEVLKTMAGEGAFRFSREQLEKYLADYAAAGYPMVSHSAQYRAVYHPAYRILCR